jgi:uncharacterized Zn finger protein
MNNGRAYDWKVPAYTKSSIKNTSGIKAKSKHGAIGETWWGKRWVTILEAVTNTEHLTSGASYARSGQVIAIDVESGLIKARVQGSEPRPYNVKMQLMPLSAQNWDKVINVMAEQAIFAARLLAGEMPTNIEEACNALDIELFPTTFTDFDTRCTCPDKFNPCKHIAAVYYLLAERFDDDPFLIFQLRGQPKERLIETLREKRIKAVENTSDPSNEESVTATDHPQSLLEERLDTFWQAETASNTFTMKPDASETNKAILKRLGHAPFTIGKENITELLARAYDTVDAAVQKESNPVRHPEPDQTDLPSQVSPTPTETLFEKKQ